MVFFEAGNLGVRMPGRRVLWVVALLGSSTPALAQKPVRPDSEVLRTSVGMTLRRIPAGTFLMGMGPRDFPPEIAAIFANEKPQHRVTIHKAFYLGVYEVTQGVYQQVAGKNPSKFRYSNRLPVEQVTWLDAVSFCNELSRREGRDPYYRIEGEQVGILGGKGFRLPTEAEWEYACRAGTTTAFPFDARETDHGKYAWFEGNSRGKTHPVGMKRRNRFGLYDMMGNVFEWCGDWYQTDYYQDSPEVDPKGPAEADARVIRGGSWRLSPELLRASYRSRALPIDSRGRPFDRDIDLGFRVAAGGD